jgi:NADH-quinone oxidoreductase subunit C
MENKINIINKNEFNTEIEISKDNLKEVADYYKKMGFNFLSDISSVDYKDHFIVVYQLFKYTENKSITIKVKLEDHKNPEIDSLTGLWETADWHEREVYDLMGIRFSGHPNLKRILMWEGYKGYPLRKDFPVVNRKRNWEVE